MKVLSGTKHTTMREAKTTSYTTTDSQRTVPTQNKKGETHRRASDAKGVAETKRITSTESTNENDHTRTKSETVTMYIVSLRLSVKQIRSQITSDSPKKEKQRTKFSAKLLQRETD